MSKHSSREYTSKHEEDPSPLKIGEAHAQEREKSEWIELAIQILLVQDSTQDSSLVQNLLTIAHDSGIEITYASSIDNARHLVGVKDFDLVLLDLSMMDLSGIEVITKMQKVKANLPIVVLSDNDNDSAGILFYQALCR